MKKALRLALGALLPVMLYCTGAALLTLKEILREDPEVMAQVAFLWLGYGFMIMGIPSIIYSVVIEYLRSKRRKKLSTCAIIGGLLGFLSGSAYLILDFAPIALVTMALPGAVIGAVIPVVLWPLKTNSEPVD